MLTWSVAAVMRVCVSPGFSPTHLPVIEPDAVGRLDLRARQARPGAAEALVVVEPVARHVGQGEVRHVKLVRAPFRGGVALARRDGAAEDGELVAEAPPVLGGDVAGVVPPLGLVVGVRAEVLRELPVARGDGAGVAAGIAADVREDSAGVDVARTAVDADQAEAEDHDRQHDGGEQC